MIDKGFGGTPVGDLVFPTGVTRKVLDNKHLFYSQQQILEALAGITKEAYVAETHDCDNFAIDAVKVIQDKYPGAPFGFATGRTATGTIHAVNVYFIKTAAGLQRFYYDATARKSLTEYDVDFIMV